MVMRTWMRVVVLLALLAVSVTALVAGPFTETWIDYFTDAAMTNQVGWYHDDCASSISSSGVQGTYRRREITSCSTGATTVTCASWNGTSWQSMPCPW
jgi:hypothetical protein